MCQRPPDFLVHRDGDYVAVAIRHLEPGPAAGDHLYGAGPIELTLREAIPLGHKLALRSIAAGQDVIEYGLRVATASADIAPGEHVHVHNVRSARWQTSV